MTVRRITEQYNINRGHILIYLNKWAMTVAQGHVQYNKAQSSQFIFGTNGTSYSPRGELFL